MECFDCLDAETSDVGKPLCKHQLEHEGGAFWCNLPIGHTGPHAPAPHEAGGLAKRTRVPPKRLSEEPEQSKKRTACKAARPVRKVHIHATDDQQDAQRRKRGPATTTHGRAHLKPVGYLSDEQIDARRQFADTVSLDELQLKLSEEMRLGGWVVLPKREKAMETGHFCVRAAAPA